MLRLLAFLLVAASAAFGSDTGFATQYHSWATNDQEYSLQWTPPFLANSTPGKWVRSDIGWVDYELTQGVYTVYGNDDQWIRTLAATGQKVVVTFNLPAGELPLASLA